MHNLDLTFFKNKKRIDVNYTKILKCISYGILYTYLSNKLKNSLFFCVNYCEFMVKIQIYLDLCIIKKFLNIFFLYKQTRVQNTIAKKLKN